MSQDNDETIYDFLMDFADDLYKGMGHTIDLRKNMFEIMGHEYKRSLAKSDMNNLDRIFREDSFDSPIIGFPFLMLIIRSNPVKDKVDDFVKRVTAEKRLDTEDREALVMKSYLKAKVPPDMIQLILHFDVNGQIGCANAIPIFKGFPRLEDVM